MQPNRGIHLRGFDHLGASAAVHDATENGFRVSGCFRDAADFAVLVLYDADDFFAHPRLKPLPDFDFGGLTLQFDLSSSGLMPLNSSKYPTIDWAYLDVATPAGSSARIRLRDHATVIANPDQPATAQFQIVGGQLDAWDRLTLWYQNMAFDYLVPGRVRTEYPFYAGELGRVHSIVIGDRAYTHVESEGDTSAMVAESLRARINGEIEGADADPEVSASSGDDPWIVRLQTRLDTGAAVPVTATGFLTENLYHVKTTTVCRALAAQINGAGYAAAQTPYSLSATASGDLLQIRTVEGGYDADFLVMYAVSKNNRLRTSQTEAKFSGGASTATLRVKLDFSALGLSQVRQMWLTFAPRLADGRDYEGENWTAAFSNWTLTGPDSVLNQRYASDDSVLIGSMDPRCDFGPGWQVETGFYLDNAARATRTPGATISVRYHCNRTHELWLGTSLYSDRGAVEVQIDGTAASGLDARLAVEPAIVTRRRLAVNVPPGDHTVRLTAVGNAPFYFDFLQAVVPGDLPAALPAQTFQTPALDYSTDHTYKLPPARILWMLDQLGAHGPLNEYIGVFWWNERKRLGGFVPELRLEFTGQFVPGDSVFLNIGGQICGKSLLLPESAAQVARHFVDLLNGSYVGVWARSEDGSLIIRTRSAAPAYRYPVTASMEHAEGSTGSVTGSGWMIDGDMGQWVLDPDAPHTLNHGARAWHEDLYRLCSASGREVTTAVSMELVYPPEEFAARYLDGQAVATATGFGGLHSTHCAFSPATLAFQKRVFLELAGLMDAAGLTPDLQCGEFTWWYFTNWNQANPGGGMAYYDAATTEAAETALGRPLQAFTSPDDDPGVNGGADAGFLANRLRDYLSSLISEVRGAFPGARFELLYPDDVNHPHPSGIHNLGGRMNRRVNLPAEWGTKVSAPFDRFKVEALDYGAWSRDLDLAVQSLELPLELGWQTSAVRAMIPVFRGGYPWTREVDYARTLGFECVSLWAFDHVCLFGWPLQSQGSGRSSRQG
jgi:hypothetical protein